MKKEAQLLWLRGLQPFGFFAVLCGLAIAVGCGGGGGGDLDAGKSEDEKKIATMVSSLADIARDLDRLRKSFTADAAPSSSEAKDIEQSKFRVVSDIDITGNTATFEVEVSSYAESSTQTTKTWKAVKEGEEWKISEAPM